MSEFYPVIRSLMTDSDWHDLIREFFINFRAETPYFPKLADEFLQFLSGRKGANDMPDYLVPLAHYELLELRLFLSEATLPEQPLDDHTLRNRHLQLTDLATPVTYQYPVHQIREGWREEAKPTYLLVFRDHADSVRFFDIQPLAYELLNDMKENEGVQITQWLTAKAKTLNQEPTKFVNFGLDLVQRFNQERLFLSPGQDDG